MAKCAVYCRVSSEEQAERGTIEGQVQYAKKYLELHGPEANITEYEFYLDDGVSGTVPLSVRPAGSRLMADAAAGKFQVLYVYRLDRLARSVKYVLDTYEMLENGKIILKSMTEAFDTGTPTGKFFMTLLASIAALERDTILERTQMGKERRAREGKWVSGAPPFGYRIGADGQLMIYEPEADTVNLIYRLYKDGLSTIDIAKYLNAMDISTPAKSKGIDNKGTGKWHAGHISIILRTSAYTGKYLYLRRSKRKKETISIDVPVIIEKGFFSQVQSKLKKNSDAARGSRGRCYLLRGIIYCGNCGRAMVGSSGSSKKGRVYYRCTGIMDVGQGKRCNAKMLRAEVIEQAVWEDIQFFLKKPGRVRELINAVLKQKEHGNNPVLKESADVEEVIFQKKAAREKVLSLCTRGVITELEAENELLNLANEMEALERRCSNLFSQQMAAQLAEDKMLNAELLLKHLYDVLEELDPKARAEIMRVLVRRIDIFTLEKEDSKKISKAVIQYRFPNS